MNKVKRAVISILNKTLPERLKRSLFHLSFHLAPSEFDRFAYEVNHAPSMELGLAAVAKRGMTPKTVIDVGAFEGDWSRMARAIWPASQIYMVEPKRIKTRPSRQRSSHCRRNGIRRGKASIAWSALDDLYQSPKLPIWNAIAWSARGETELTNWQTGN